MKRLLVTGAFGFLGSHVVKHFKVLGFYVVGMGTCTQGDNGVKSIVDKYIISELTLDILKELEDNFDAIIHCAGGSSVGKSMINPNKDLLNTTLGTEIVLEYIRLYSPETRMVYISSAAVYGDKHTSPIEEDSFLSPMSFYGVHKYLSEELCAFYNNRYNISVSIVRFFSIYGPGLKKQLLWDACNKISSGVDPLMFFGTGDELRDWIEITDALAFIELALNCKESLLVLNAGTGKEFSVKSVIKTLVEYFDSSQEVLFNQETKIGDPYYLCANVDRALSKKWTQQISVKEGLKRYVKWYKIITKTN